MTPAALARAWSRLADLAISDDDPAVRALGAAMLAVRDGSEPDLDSALLGKPGRLETTLRRGQRYQLLHEAADAFGLGAAELCAELTSYAARAWPRESDAAECPARHGRELQSICWRIMKLGLGPPPSLSTVERALRHSPPLCLTEQIIESVLSTMEF